MKKNIEIFALSFIILFYLSACGEIGGGNDHESVNLNSISDDEMPPVTDDTEKEELASVDNVNVVLMESFPLKATIRVSGYLRNGCEQLMEPEINKTGNTFYVTLPVESVGDFCTMALEGYEKNISLNIEGLSAGTYTVTVNEVSDTFTLERDNKISLLPLEE